MNVYQKTKRFFNFHYHSHNLEQRLKYTMRYDYLVDKALHSQEQGVSDECYCDHEIIVSLTTFGKRLYAVAPTIESIMQGSMKPNRIILWLGDNMKEVSVPLALQLQQRRGLEIAYCKDVRSYTKLIPTLYNYPNASIITIDDDALYYYDLVEKLVNAHKVYPKHIIANRIHRIKLGNDGRPLGYMRWQWNSSPTDDSPLNFFTGVGGTLYPPHSLHPEVLNENVFMDICKFADDVWFFSMALMAGTRTKKCYTHSCIGEDYLLNENVQDVGLNNINTTKINAQHCENDTQIKAVFDKYNLWKKLIE